MLSSETPLAIYIQDLYALSIICAVMQVQIKLCSFSQGQHPFTHILSSPFSWQALPMNSTC